MDKLRKNSRKTTTLRDVTHRAYLRPGQEKSSKNDFRRSTHQISDVMNETSWWDDVETLKNKRSAENSLNYPPKKSPVPKTWQVPAENSAIPDGLAESNLVVERAEWGIFSGSTKIPIFGIGILPELQVLESGRENQKWSWPSCSSCWAEI